MREFGSSGVVGVLGVWEFGAMENLVIFDIFVFFFLIADVLCVLDWRIA